MFPARNSSLPSWQWGVLPPPLHLFMFIHAQKVSLYLTSYPLASPFSWPAIWPPPPPCYLCLLSHPHLDHPLFSYHSLSSAIPYKHSLCSSRCGGKRKASDGKSQGVGEILEQAKATTEVQAQAAPKTRLSQLPSIPSCRRPPPPTAYFPFPT